MNEMTVAEVIRKKLKEKNMKQQEFADRCEVSMSCVGYWLRGRNIPSGYNLIKIANALDCTVEELYGLERR